MTLAHHWLAAQAFNQPLYSTPELLLGVKNVLLPRLGLPAPAELAASEPAHGAAVVPHGAIPRIAVIAVHGILTARHSLRGELCGDLTSYERLRGQISQALGDPAIDEIVLDINSGGGMAVGCEELADYIYAARGQKPITALVNYAAYSAAYFLAAACDRIVLSASGGVGSIGVVLEHMDVSAADAQNGIVFTHLARGAHKTDGNPHAALSTDALAAINARLDDTYQRFATAVARYRRLELASVIGTEAAIYNGRAALDAGLADELTPSPQDWLNQRSTATPHQRSNLAARTRAAISQ
ncbi:MAG: S49 family peptidase [Aeromonas sp.]